METNIHALLMATASTGQIITKNTGVSIILVGIIVTASVSAALWLNNMSHDVADLQQDMSEIKSLLREAATKSADVSLIEDAIHNVLFVEEIE